MTNPKLTNLERLLMERDKLWREMKRLEQRVEGIDLAIKILQEHADTSTKWTKDEAGNLSRTIGH